MQQDSRGQNSEKTPPLGKRRSMYRVRRRAYLTHDIAAPAADALQPPAQELDPVRADDRAGEVAALRDRVREAEAQASQGRIGWQQAEKRLRDLDTMLKERDRALQEKDAAIAERDAALRQKAEQLAAKEKAFADAQQVLDEAKAQVQRSRQEMEQQRRRHTRDQDELRKSAAEDLLRQLFPTLDHFHMAIEAVSQGGEPEAHLRGILMMHRELDEVLRRNGFKPIEALNQPFDPRHHDAVAAEADATKPDGVVLRILRPGYLLNDKPLRPAMVVVNRLPEAKEEPPAPEAVVEMPPEEPELRSVEQGREELSPLERARRVMETRADL